MNNIIEYKRMNFFTGFFTTAQDWNDGQQYHLEKRRLHNRTMHSPGIVRDEKNELRIIAKGGFVVEIQPGAALDGYGREIYISQPYDLTIDPATTGTLYIAVQYSERDSDYVENDQEPLYSGYTRVTEAFTLQARASLPNNEDWMELARIDFKNGLSEITTADIDRSNVLWAGAVGVVLPQLDPAVKERIKDEMGYKRETFAELTAIFPVPSIADVRYIALSIDLLVRSNNLQTERVQEVLELLALVELDVEQEIGNRYNGIVNRTEYQEYQNKVGVLNEAVSSTGSTIDDLLDLQHDVTAAAHDLSQMVLSPGAEAGVEQTVQTTGDEATVLLDARNTTSILDVVRYRWNKVNGGS
ncbi:MAG: hypothetical protein PVF82_14825 [Gammaproteobacteria bacterium]|jgi:hypothetical protein